MFPIRLRILVALTPRIMRVLSTKTASVMHNFRNWGLVKVWVSMFDETPQKAHLCLFSRILSHYAYISVQI